ncbi:MAG: response regulator [Nitrospirales bacterium]
MSARILVIDDDEAIRLLCRRALETGGYLVSCTGNPEEALALLDEEPVDLLIVDVLLAPLDLQFRSRHSVSRLDNGMQVVQAALAKRRDTPILFISSHSRTILLSKGVDGNRWPVLRKPFSPQVLRTEVAMRLQAAHEKTGLGRDPRKRPRSPFRCPVQYSGDHVGDGMTENLSLGGCLLNTHQVLQINSHLTARLLLPNETPIQIHIAVTKWGTLPKFGLDFLLIDEEGERKLLEVLKRLQP